MSDPALTGGDGALTEWLPLLASADMENRERCIADPMFLIREVIGEAGVEAGLYAKNLFRTPCRFHVESNEVLRDGGNALILAPRMHLKTAFITVGGTIHSLIRNPNHRNLIISETPSLSTKVLREIKWHFQKNERFRRWFPEYRMDTSKEEGTEGHFDVPCRNGPKKDYSVEAIGIGGATAGSRSDTMRFTDMLSDKTTPPLVTPETMQKTWHEFRGMGSILDKTNKAANIIVEGTIWNGGDAYCQILTDPGYAHWRKIVYSCWVDRGARTPLWPEVYSADELDRIRGERGAYIFSCNYENDPQPDPEEAMFQASYFKLYSYGDTPPGTCPCCGGRLSKAVTVDPAIGKKRSNDRTAIVTSGVCPRGSLVVISTQAQRVDPGAIIEALYDVDRIEKPEWMGVETVAYQKMLLWALHEESKKEGRYPLPLRILKSDEQKERRIALLAAYARSRGIWVRAGDHDELVDECLKMTLAGTMGRHDDLPDALAYRLQGMGRPDGPVIDVQARTSIPGRTVLLGEEVLKRIEEAEDEAEV